MERIIKTFFITWIYCIVWILLEAIFYGKIENRTVDNIIMLLFIPMIYRATKEKSRGRKE